MTEEARLRERERERERERRGFTIFKMHGVMCVDRNTTNMERERGEMILTNISVPLTYMSIKGLSLSGFGTMHTRIQDS